MELPTEITPKLPAAIQPIILVRKCKARAPQIAAVKQRTPTTQLNAQYLAGALLLNAPMAQRKDQTIREIAPHRKSQHPQHVGLKNKVEMVQRERGAEN